jgi:hypothetical protein
MRTSSMKSHTAVATLVMTLVLAVPCAEAKPAKPRESTTRSVIATVKRLIHRYFTITPDWKPGDPVPSPLRNDEPVIEPTSPIIQ